MSNLCKAWTLSSAKSYTEFKTLSEETGNPLEMKAVIKKENDCSPVIRFKSLDDGISIDNYVVKEYRKKVDELFDDGKVLELILGVKNYKNVDYIGLVELTNEDKRISESIYYFSEDGADKFRRSGVMLNSWPENYRRFVNGRLSVYFSDFMDCVPECSDSLIDKLVFFRPKNYVPSVRKDVKFTFGEEDVPEDNNKVITYNYAPVVDSGKKKENFFVSLYKRLNKNSGQVVIRSRR